MCLELSNFMSCLVLRKYYCDISNSCQRLYTVVTVCYYGQMTLLVKKLLFQVINDTGLSCDQLYIYFPQKIQTSHKVPRIVRYVSCQILLRIKVLVLMMTCSSLWHLGRSLAGHWVSFLIQKF